MRDKWLQADGLLCDNMLFTESERIIIASPGYAPAFRYYTGLLVADAEDGLLHFLLMVLKEGFDIILNYKFRYNT